MKAKVRMGMVGGGEGAFIGAIHRMAAALDGEIVLVAGCFSSDSNRSRKVGQSLYLAPERVYNDFQRMMESEAALADDERIEFVAVVTPNHLHFPIAVAALRHGFPVLCDKPVAVNLEEAIELKHIVDNSECLFGLTYTYAAYPMVCQARAMIDANELGAVRRVSVSYSQGWLAGANASAQAQWRTDPNKSGESGCFADIGSHAHHLIETVTGLTVVEVCADLSVFVEGRLLEDDGATLLRMHNGAKGVLTASQICTGEGNNLQIVVYCDLGSIMWQQEAPNTLTLKRKAQPAAILKAGNNCTYLNKRTLNYCRTPEGHPEGYIEAFANIYRDFACAIRARCNPSACFASIDEGVRAMAFVRAVLDSSRNHSTWIAVKKWGKQSNG